MINSVRNTVFSVLNKNNYGYISPQDFNLFAKQAQLEIFEDYFTDYNTSINKENARMSGTEYADMTKGIEESIDTFSVIKNLDQKNYNKYFTPSQITTGDDYYLLNKVLAYTTFKVGGTSDGYVLNSLIDTTATFTVNVAVGDIVVNTTSLEQAEVLVVQNNTRLDLDDNIFTQFIAPFDNYSIFKPENYQVEKVTNSKISMLANSILTAPTKTFPAYSLNPDSVTVLPKTINNAGQIFSQYIRYPKDPKWTYNTLTGGQPVFDQSQSDFQDFELPIDDEVRLVTKILQYSGMQIRETEVVQFANLEEQKDNQ
ncbi:unnamed protein product [marine sediment metagenome]|uniref:Uncharacterized protein n=1 Tax=marine sediment metagenome TaxID=412755 RepID=X0SEL5_9ZZZZ